ncbi:MAG TPA: phosphate acyltransferase PlsX [Bacteroidales bacterium]|nr:phosphate acyltransferase PlsX [Bacteroidales bacterium]
MRLGLDVFGGDHAPASPLESLKLLAPELSQGCTIVLFGDEQQIAEGLKDVPATKGKFEVVHCPEVITMSDKPVKAFKAKSASSIVRGFEWLKNGQIDMFASAGNSGAMFVGATNVIGTIPGIIRPASLVPLPNLSGSYKIILDVGTNPDARADVLYQYGFLGSVYASVVMGIQQPKVALLNIGEEEKKGNLLVQSAYQMMKETADFNFIGNVEGRDLFNDKADVVVCDGFTGNIVIKQLQAIYRIMEKRGLLDSYFARFNYETYGGTPIIGINGNVIIGHGISSPLAIKNMMLLGREVAESRLSEKIKDALDNFGIQKFEWTNF